MSSPVVDPTRSGGAMYRFLRSIPTWVLWIIVAVWITPTMGLLVNSFRGRAVQQTSGWCNVALGHWRGFTLDTYRAVLESGPGANMRTGLANSLAIALPATIIPIGIAAFAAYAFAWIDFKGRQTLFIATVALLAIPLQ